MIGWESLPLDPPTKCCSRASERLKLRLVALHCFAVAHFVTISSASAQDPGTVGQFSSVMPFGPDIAVHAHALPTGKVLWWPSFDYGYYPQLWDPSTNTITPAAQPGANIFCSGHAFLPNGQLFVAGGHVSSFVGLPNAYTYDPLANTWTRLPDMNNGRWYPTSTTLPNGDMLVISGWIDTSVGVNVEPQVWQSATASWRYLTAADLALPFYPFMFVAPNGKVFCAGPSQTTRYLDVTGAGAWSSAANNNYGDRNWGSSVMYDDGKVLIMGGSRSSGIHAETGETSFEYVRAAEQALEEIKPETALAIGAAGFTFPRDIARFASAPTLTAATIATEERKMAMPRNIPTKMAARATAILVVRRFMALR